MCRQRLAIGRQPALPATSCLQSSAVACIRCAHLQGLCIGHFSGVIAPVLCVNPVLNLLNEVVGPRRGCNADRGNLEVVVAVHIWYM